MPMVQTLAALHPDPQSVLGHIARHRRDPGDGRRGLDRGAKARLRAGAPAAPEHPVSQTGDLWILGRHRLLCGDSTVATDVERVLGGVEPHLMVTDPPYGVRPWPADRVERWSIDRLIPYAKNARTHTDAQVRQHFPRLGARARPREKKNSSIRSTGCYAAAIP